MLLFLSHFDAVFPTINRDEPNLMPEEATEALQEKSAKISRNKGVCNILS